MSMKNQFAEILALREKARVGIQRAESLLEKHRQDFAKYETALAVLAEIAPEEFKELGEATSAQIAEKTRKTGSIGSRILVVMEESSKLWWTANEIQEALAERGDEIKMTSISPNLSRLASDGAIRRDGLNVALANRLDEKSSAPEDNLFERSSSEADIQSRDRLPAGTPAQGREAGPGGGTC